MHSSDELVDAIVERHAHQFEALRSSREQTIGRRILAAPRGLRHLVDRLRRFDPEQAVHQGQMLDVRVGLIADEFTQLLFRDVCTVVDMHPWHWRRQLADIDVLFVESAWLGQHGHWQYLVSAVGHRTPNPLPALVEECKRQSIPTIFWNKEDPYGFLRFLPASIGFDLIASTESTTEGWYRQLRPESMFAVVPFGINPSIHHPVDAPGDRLDRVIFSGSWIVDDFEERRAWGELLLGAAHERAMLDIYARDGQAFPSGLSAAVRGTLAASQVPAETKRYAAALNLNSIATGQTMLSRRVVESLALGVPVISSPSPALRDFGDVCTEVRTAADVQQALDVSVDRQIRPARSWSAWADVHERFSWPKILGGLLEMVDVPAPAAALSVRWCATEAEFLANEAGWTGQDASGGDERLRAMAELAVKFGVAPVVVVRNCTESEMPLVRTRSAESSAGSVIVVDRSVVTDAEARQLATGSGAGSSLTMVELLVPQ